MREPWGSLLEMVYLATVLKGNLLAGLIGWLIGWLDLKQDLTNVGLA